MINHDSILSALDKMILSASGWRGVFAADGDEESKTSVTTEEHRFICASAAFLFFNYLKSLPSSSGGKPLILLGADTRPTGRAIAEAMIQVLRENGCDAQYAGFAAAPEIMAWARTKKQTAGFIYISASHNPVGHNGLKFGLTDGGVLTADEANKLIADFKAFIYDSDKIKKIENDLRSERVVIDEKTVKQFKNDALKSYFNFCNDVFKGSGGEIISVVKNNIKEKPLGIVCDFNGSARASSIDKEFFSSFGFKFEYINGEPGNIAHRIVPEGESLEPCRVLLEEARGRDASFILGYVPDCDGDRGNLVIYNEAEGRARALEAQEVFALACVAEFSHLVWTGEISFDYIKNYKKTYPNDSALFKAAVAVNDPTSMRVNRIAEAFGIEVYRAEVGEANVVSLARKLRENGYIVRILGEGSAGGNITHPSAVRDPVNTVLAIAKLLTVRSINGKKGFFEIWCELSGQAEKYRNNFSISDIIASLPEFISTPSYNKDAIMRVKEKDHGLLKNRYQKIFLEEWDKQKDHLKTRFGIFGWEAVSYNGTNEKRGLTRFSDAGRGGLKIIFVDNKMKEIAYIWMRGSATEPVFRVMADVEGKDIAFERYLLDWQRQMIMKADI
ncbi:MAG: phosphatidylglycerol lysyltransferase [Treponema sp.]|nr:phosphatidylglycerol lysyltransferase [Treponema sp.]